MESEFIIIVAVVSEFNIVAGVVSELNIVAAVLRTYVYAHDDHYLTHSKLLFNSLLAEMITPQLRLAPNTRGTGSGFIEAYNTYLCLWVDHFSMKF